MDLWQATILGLIEGLTEFLPISSTGHLILASHTLGLTRSGALSSYEIVIQSGAIAAVFLFYHRYIASIIKGLLDKERWAMKLTLNLFVAFLPAVIVGLLFGSYIKQFLFDTYVVGWTLLLGGIAMIAAERALRKRADRLEDLAQLSLAQSLAIGMFQCLALIPGTSRAMTSILGARLAGLNIRAAADFSFLLAIPTLLGACAYELMKGSGAEIWAQIGGSALMVGLVTSFVSAALVIAGFLSFLKKHGFEVFGWYRIVLGLIILWILA